MRMEDGMDGWTVGGWGPKGFWWMEGLSDPPGGIPGPRAVLKRPLLAHPSCCQFGVCPSTRGKIEGRDSSGRERGKRIVSRSVGEAAKSLGVVAVVPGLPVIMLDRGASVKKGRELD